MGIEISPPGPETGVGPTASLVAFGTVTGPAAFATVAIINAPSPGLYELTIYSELSGTVAAADQDNLRLQINAVTISRLPLSAVITSGDVQVPVSMKVSVPAGNITLQANGAATGTAVYSALLVATKVG